MTIAHPIRFHENVETYDDNEAETIAGLNATFDEILDTTARITGTRCDPCTPRRTASCRASSR